MVATDDIVAGCVEALADADPRGAVRDVLRRALADPNLPGSLGEPKAGLSIWYRSPEVTVINFVWPPLMCLFPHDHRMWAAIGIYGGREDNAFYRRDGGTIVPSGGKELCEGDVVLLGRETIHSVENPARSYTGAIHVYGGDFVGTQRSRWDADTLQEQPFDLDALAAEFERAEERFAADG